MMLDTDDLRHHTEVGTGYSKDAQLARAADEIDRLRGVAQQRDELLAALEKLLAVAVVNVAMNVGAGAICEARAVIAKGKVGAGETAKGSARQMIARLVDVMDRSDAEQFGAEVETVTGDEWFAAIRDAKEMLA